LSPGNRAISEKNEDKIIKGLPNRIEKGTATTCNKDKKKHFPFMKKRKRNRMSRKEIPFTKDDLEKIAKRFPTPFHIYDEKGIRENAKELLEAFKWNADFKEYFAVKAIEVAKALCVIDRETGGLEKLQEVGIELLSLFKQSEIDQST
jgi:hypothetical protein